MKVNELPAELLVVVLSRLDGASLSRAASTCVTLHRIERSNACTLWEDAVRSAQFDTQLSAALGLSWKALYALKAAPNDRPSAPSLQAIRDEFEFFAEVSGDCGCDVLPSLKDVKSVCPTHAAPPFVVPMVLDESEENNVYFETPDGWEGPPPNVQWAFGSTAINVYVRNKRSMAIAQLLTTHASNCDDPEPDIWFQWGWCEFVHGKYDHVDMALSVWHDLGDQTKWRQISLSFDPLNLYDFANRLNSKAVSWTPCKL
jgi:hypothetical protein